jgi:hypothetical protein
LKVELSQPRKRRELWLRLAKANEVAVGVEVEEDTREALKLISTERVEVRQRILWVERLRKRRVLVEVSWKTVTASRMRRLREVEAQQ